MITDIKLIRFAEAEHGKVFEWGHTDCAMLALRALDVLMGRNVSENFIGQWRNEQEALAYFQVDLPSAVLHRLGLIEVVPGACVIGDILLARKDPFPETAHLCMGRRCLSASVANGVIYLNTSAVINVASSAWRVR